MVESADSGIWVNFVSCQAFLRILQDLMNYKHHVDISLISKLDCIEFYQSRKVFLKLFTT